MGATGKTSANNSPNSGGSQGQRQGADGLTLEAIKAQVFSMDIGSVETKLAKPGT